MAWKRLVSRIVFLAVLVAIGYAVHLLLPPAPRWTLTGPFEILALTSDSQHFWTIGLNSARGQNGRRRGPLQLRNLDGGAVVAEYMKSEPGLFNCKVSPSGRFVIAYGENTVYIVDLERTSEHNLLLDDQGKQQIGDTKRGGFDDVSFGSAEFSRNEAYLGLGQTFGGSDLIETSTGKIKKRLAGGLRGFLRNDSYAVLGGRSLWNIAESREEEDRFQGYSWGVGSGDFSPSGLQMVVYKDQNLSEAAVLDVTDWELRKLPPRVNREFFCGLWFTDAGRWLIDFESDRDRERCRVQIYESLSGKQVGEYEFHGYESLKAGFFGATRYSKNDAHCIFTSGSPTGQFNVEMVQLPEGRRIWARPLGSGIPTFNLTADDSIVIAVESDSRIERWDLQTGAMVRVLWDFKRPTGIYKRLIGDSRNVDPFSWPPVSKDRTLIHCEVERTGAAGWWDEWAVKYLPWMIPTGLAFVADARDGRLLLQVPINKVSSSTRLSNDNRTLVMSQTEVGSDNLFVHRAYDIPAGPRWGWIVCVPAGLGVLVLGWRRWRKRKGQTVTAAN